MRLRIAGKYNITQNDIPFGLFFMTYILYISVFERKRLIPGLCSIEISSGDYPCIVVAGG